MYIARLQVEEGFLNALDITFSTGLNVIIGPRGSGKTSIIELVRYALGARGITERASAVGEAHARSILEGGQVTVTLRDGANEVIAIRSSAEDRPRLSGKIVPPTVLSQNEIESIGVSALGRLRLLDAFRRQSPDAQLRVEALRQRIREASVEVQEATAQVDEVDEQIVNLKDEVALLGEKEREYHEQLARIAAADDKQAALQKLSAVASRLAVAVGVYDRTDQRLRSWLVALQAAKSRAAVVEHWPTSAGDEDQLTGVREILRLAADSVADACSQVTRAIADIDASKSYAAAERIAVEEQARALRGELEELHAGSGALARRLADLNEKAGQVAALSELRTQLQGKRAELIRTRDSMLDELEKTAAAAFEERDAIAKSLTAAQGRRIEVSVRRGGLTSAYQEALVAALKGSGIRHSALAQQIVERLSPRELVTLVESRAAREIAELLGIGIDRAARLVAALGNGGTESLVACEMEDAVTLSLLDGTDYKDSEHLSTGQRCTAVLPLLLARPGRTLVIDQPEDHLDNAFIVDVAVNSIRGRDPSSQLIFSTHNPNIPVLGSADRVVLMGSDGQHGFVRSAGPLDDTASVNAITTVMEGGLAAFEKRSDFYRQARP